MASPVTVISNPLDQSQHILFWLSLASQLAVEQRPLDQSQGYDAYQDFGLPKGIIVNPSSLAAVLHMKMVTVYGITQPNMEDSSWHVSKVSPYYNLIASGPSAVANTPALAACSNPIGVDYIYYMQLPTGSSTYEILEFQMIGNTGKPSPPISGAIPSENSNLAACYFKANMDRFIFFTNTDKKHFIYYTNSTSQNQQSISGTGSVNAASPLAVCTLETADAGLTVFLYYMDINQQLNRVVGTANGAAGTGITWARNRTLGVSLKSTTLMTATTTGTQNYVYFIQDGQATFSPYVDPINDDMFKPPSS